MQEITPGITRAYAHEERIVIYSVSSLRVCSLKSWSDDVIATLEHWPEYLDTYLTLCDLSIEGVAVPFLALTGYNIYNLGVTRAGQKRVDVILDNRPGLKAKMALLFSPSMSGDMALRRGLFPGTSQPRIEYKVFFDRPGAIAWLEPFATS